MNITKLVATMESAGLIDEGSLERVRTDKQWARRKFQSGAAWRKLAQQILLEPGKNH